MSKKVSRRSPFQSGSQVLEGLGLKSKVGCAGLGSLGNNYYPGTRALGHPFMNARSPSGNLSPVCCMCIAYVLNCHDTHS